MNKNAKNCIKSIYRHNVYSFDELPQEDQTEVERCCRKAGLKAGATIKSAYRAWATMSQEDFQKELNRYPETTGGILWGQVYDEILSNWASRYTHEVEDAIANLFNTFGSSIPSK